MVIQTLDDRVVYLDDAGNVKGEATFEPVSDGVVDITHVFVAESERGRGLAGQLMKQLVRHLRFAGEKARVSCSYAKAWFERNPEWRDVLE